MRTPSTKSRAIGALLLAGALVLIAVLLREPRSSDRSVEPLAPHAKDAAGDSLLPVAASEATSRFAADVAEVDEPALDTQAIAQPDAALTRFDYGVSGKVQFTDQTYRPLDWKKRCKITAVNIDGETQSDSIEYPGQFQLFELGPGRWTVEADLGPYGRVVEVVELTARQPEVELVMWVVPPIEIDVRITLAAHSSLEQLTGAGRRSHTIVAHRGAVPGIRTKFRDLPPLSYMRPSAMRMQATGELFLQTDLRLAADEPMTISLFVDGMWVASRQRAVGENTIEWLLEPGLSSPAQGSLALTLLDAATGAALPGPVWIQRTSHRRIAAQGTETVAFDRIPPGWLLIEAGGGTHERVWLPIFVGPGERVHETLRLAPTIVLAGHVSGPDQDALAVTVGAWKLDDNATLESPVFAGFCKSNQGGEFAFDSLGPGTYLVRSMNVPRGGYTQEERGRERASQLVVVDARTSRTDVVVRLEPASTLLLSAGAADGPARHWKVLDRRGRFLYEGVLESVAPRRLSLPNGSYTVVLEREGDSPQRIPVELTPSGARVEL